MMDSAGGVSQVRRDLAKLKRERRAAVRSRWLRGIGRVTRPVVYVGPLLFVAGWLWSYISLPNQFLESLSPIDFFLIGGCVIGFFGVAIPAMLFLLSVEGEEVDWEAWGCVGVGLVAALPAVWATLKVTLY